MLGKVANALLYFRGMTKFGKKEYEQAISLFSKIPVKGTLGYKSIALIARAHYLLEQYDLAADRFLQLRGVSEENTSQGQQVSSLDDYFALYANYGLRKVSEHFDLGYHAAGIIQLDETSFDDVPKSILVDFPIPRTYP